MSVVRRATARRWATALTGIAALCALPPAIAARPVSEPPAVPVPELVARARASAEVAHSGLVEVRAGLGIPELPRLGQVSTLLDGTTRARVWWSSPSRWRVAELAAAGERDLTATPDGVATWDYERRVTSVVTGDPAVRLPRVDDLLPPQAARRILDILGPEDRVETLPARRVAGVSAAGILLRPSDPRSRIADIAMWLDPDRGLPLAVEVHDADHAAPVFSSRFLDVELANPPVAVTATVFPPGARTETTRTPDLAASVDRTGPWQLPDRLAGLPRADAARSVAGVTGGAATYGTGLTRFVVLPLPPDVARDALARARPLAPPLNVSGGEAIPLQRPLLSLVIARGAAGPDGNGTHAYLLTGMVQAGVLQRAVAELFASPPPARGAGT